MSSSLSSSSADEQDRNFRESKPLHVTPPAPKPKPKPFMQLAARASQSVTSDGTFWLVELPDGGTPVISEIDDLEQLLERLRALDGTDTFAYVFLGQRLRITRSQPRYLLTPAGAVQITVASDATDEDDEDDGFMGETVDDDIPTELPGRRGTWGEEDTEDGEATGDDFETFGGPQ